MNIRDAFLGLVKKGDTARRMCWMPGIYVYVGPPIGMFDHRELIFSEAARAKSIGYDDILADDWEICKIENLKYAY